MNSPFSAPTIRPSFPWGRGHWGLFSSLLAIHSSTQLGAGASLSRTQTLLSSFSRVLVSPREPSSPPRVVDLSFTKPLGIILFHPKYFSLWTSLLGNGILFLMTIKCRHCSLSTPLLTVFSPLSNWAPALLINSGQFLTFLLLTTAITLAHTLAL